MKHICGIRGMSREQIDLILDRAQAIKNKKQTNLLVDGKVKLLFLEPSTRTLDSFEAAADNLGLIKSITSGSEGTSLAKKETFANTVRMMAGYGANILVTRTPWSGAPIFAAEISEAENLRMGIQNAGDGPHAHPTQALLDLLTILEFRGHIDGLRIGFVGDLKYSRTIHSLLAVLRLYKDIQVVLVSPPETTLPWFYKRELDIVAEGKSLDLLADCDFAYVTRIQRERFLNDEQEYRRASGSIIVGPAFIKQFPDVKIMHPLPCVDEIDHHIFGAPQVIMFEQAKNGVPIRMATLLSGLADLNSSPIIFPGLRQKIQEKCIKEEAIEEITGRKRRQQKYFRPINNGTVIDHLLPGTSMRILSVLRRIFGLAKLKDQVIVTAINLPGSQARKDVLTLENVFVPGWLGAIIQLIAPMATFNFVSKEKQTVRKVQFTAPEFIDGIFDCPGGHCIANVEPEAQAKFQVFSQEGETYFRCLYCGVFSSQQEVTGIQSTNNV